MTSAEMNTRVRTLLDESSAAFWSDAQIYVALTEGQNAIIREALSYYITRGEYTGFVPSILKPLIASTGTTATTSTASYSLPADFLYEIRVEFNPTATATLYPTRKRDNSASKQFLADNTYMANVSPNEYFYSVFGGNLVFSTVPTASGGYDLHYIKQPADLASGTDSELADIAHDVIVNFAMHSLLIKDQLYQEALAHFETGMRQLASLLRI
jgi:hypothetical protein